jgi:hypothetical protein
MGRHAWRPPIGAGKGWTVVLRRQAACSVDGRREGGYSNMFEINCCDPGVDPSLDYCEVSPRLQLVGGPYSFAASAGAYEQHLGLQQQPDGAVGRGR